MAGCSLPRGAPVQSRILAESSKEDADFTVLAVSRSSVDRIAKWPKPKGAMGHDWPRSGGGAPGSTIATGDRISLTVWEAGDTPLMAGAGEKSVDLREAEVGRDGAIFVPWLGKVQLRGLSHDAAREKIQTALADRLDTPQVQLSVSPGRQNTVDLVGGVNSAGNYPLPDRNYTVLALIGQGGGPATSLKNPQVSLIRGARVHRISFERLTREPALDLVLQGGDRVVVEEERRYFLSLGAASRQSQILFPQDRVTALDAVALLGGVAASRADPGGVLVLREYGPKALRRDGSGPDRQRMVFSLDLTSADGLFSARNFLIEHGDLVLVTESPVTSLRTILGLFGQGVGIAAAADDLSNGN